MQFLAGLEHSSVTIVNAYDLLTVVMGLENVPMAVTRQDVVSY